MEDLKIDNLTPEQKKELLDCVSKARNRLTWASLKAGLGLFAANSFSILVGKVLFVDADPCFVIGYQIACIVVNVYFVSRYFSGQMHANSDIVKNKIEEVLKK